MDKRLREMINNKKKRVRLFPKMNRASRSTLIFSRHFILLSCLFCTYAIVLRLFRFSCRSHATNLLCNKKCVDDALHITVEMCEATYIEHTRIHSTRSNAQSTLLIHKYLFLRQKRRHLST